MTINQHGFDLNARASLDSAIVPQSNSVDLTAPPHTLFLTGATGFVGAYLLRDLLEYTSADIYCLVRAETPEHGLQRIRQNLSKYIIWKDSYPQRILPLNGDLKNPLFGLDEKTFREISETADAIYHCGSKLSYIAPYEYLESANIGGTQEALRLTTMGKPKPMHFISSLGILLAYQNLMGGNEDDELDQTKCPPIGYFQTKYVAELMVRMARDRGVPVTVHRIGLIVGDSQTGVSNIDDFVARMMVGCIKAKVAPEVKNPMDMTPVDFVSQAMVHLSRQPSSMGKVFHLLNPKPIHWSDIFDMVIAAGYPVMKYPFNQWVEVVEDYVDNHNPLHPLLPFFQIGFARRMLGVSDAAYKALGTDITQKALHGSGIDCPPVDQKLTNTFLSHFIRSGRLDEPIYPPRKPDTGLSQSVAD